jgi:glycosyltransferase involved in cell wall biosynthesis
MSTSHEPAVALVARTDSRTTGLARYVYSLADHFMLAGLPARLSPPLPPPLPPPLFAALSRSGVDLRTFFANYPLRADLRGARVVHLTSQNQATLLAIRPTPPAVVTVHDLWWLVARQTGRRLGGAELAGERLALTGLRRARALIAISAYTKDTIVDLLGIPAERVTVVHRAVDLERFAPRPAPVGLRACYGLPEGVPLLLYVGSEDPRKNLGVLVEAFGMIATLRPDAVLVKAGAVHFPAEAARLRRRVEALGLGGRFHLLEHLPDEDLPALYNAAAICVAPSLFEGFGLTALEAMACGRPVIAGSASSLPEVIGDAGMLFDPHSPTELARIMLELLEAPERCRELGLRARARALTFSLERQAAETWAIYRHVAASAARSALQYTRAYGNRK